MARLTSITDALSQSEYYGYDENGNLLSEKHADLQIIYFSYDQLNRQTQIQYPDETNDFAYDPASNLESMVDPHGATYFGYDPLNRLISEKSPSGDFTHWQFDAASRRTQISIQEGGTGGYGKQSYGPSAYGGGPGAAAATYYGYDQAGRMTTATDLTGQAQTYYQFDDNGNLTRKQLGNGVYTERAYDQANRLISLHTRKSDGSTLTYFGYDYDAASRIVGIEREDGINIYYTYDNDDRLTGERWLDAANAELYGFEWDYDAVGNRSYQRDGTEQTYYSYNEANELEYTHEISADAWSYYSYDPNGNLTLMDEPAGLTYFEYTPANLVSAIRYPSGICNYFHYDAMLRRYAIEDSDGLRYLTWDANGMNLLMEKDIDGNITAVHTPGYATQPGIGSRIRGAITTGGTTYYAHDSDDPRGSVIKQTNAAGDVIRHTEYNAFGQVLGQSTSGPDIPNRFGYQSNWITLKDSNGRFGLSPTRTYDAAQGRFVQRDPLLKARAAKNLGALRASPLARSIPLGDLFKGYPPVRHLDGSSLYSAWFAVEFSTDARGLLITKEKGLQSFEKSRKALDNLCETCCPGKCDCNANDCKKETKHLVDALIKVWREKYDPKANQFQWHIDSFHVGGRSCGSWATYFTRALKAGEYECLSGTKRHRDNTKPKKYSWKFHQFLEVYVCKVAADHDKRTEKELTPTMRCTVSFDYGVGDEVYHEGLFEDFSFGSKLLQTIK